MFNELDSTLHVRDVKRLFFNSLYFSGIVLIVVAAMLSVVLFVFLLILTILLIYVFDVLNSSVKNLKKPLFRKEKV